MAKTSTRLLDCELREVAALDFEPIRLPAIDWADPQHQQQLWLLQVAMSLLGKTRADLGKMLDGLAGDNGKSLAEMSIGLNDAAEFFLASHQICKDALARMVIVGAGKASGIEQEKVEAA